MTALPGELEACDAAAQKRVERYGLQQELEAGLVDFAAGWVAHRDGVDMADARHEHCQDRYPWVDDRVAGERDFEAGYDARGAWLARRKRDEKEPDGVRQ